MKTPRIVATARLRFSCLCVSLFVMAAFPVRTRAESIWIAVVSLNAPPAIANAYQPGTTLTLSSYTQPAPSGSLQWLHDDQPIPGATNLPLILSNLSSVDAGNYRLRTTSGTAVTYSNTLTINVLPSTTSATDSTFTSQLPADFWAASVTAFAADGSFIVQSSATNPPPPIRLAADGSVVTSFNYPATAGVVLAGFPDGRLLTASAPYLIAADGSPLAFTLPAPFDSTKPLSGAVVAPDGKFLLSQGTAIVRFLGDGTVDSSFSFSTADASATAYAVDAQGRTYVSTRRLASVPSDYPSSWTVIYRLQPSGARDLVFGEQTSIFTYNTWFKVVPLADGRTFYWSAYHGYRAWKIFNADGSLDPNWSGGVFTERDIIVDPVRSDVYVVPTSGFLQRYHLGATALTEDPTFFAGITASTYSLPPFTVAPDGKLLAFTNTSAWDGHATQNLARLRTDIPRPLLPPSVGIAGATTPTRGATTTLDAHVSGGGSYTYQWLALDGQPLPANTTSPSLVLPNFSAANLGRYQVRVNGAFGSVLSGVVDLELGTASLPFLANLSGRAVPGSGEDTTIAGVTTKIYAGALPVSLMIRGVGPGLKDVGVSNYLPNPALNLRDLSGSIVANNDNWSANVDRDTIRTDFSATGAFALAENSLDAALLKSSYNEQFTVNLFNQSDATGVGLLEIYRVPNDLVAGELTNLSLRARTGPGEAVAIAGFVIVDPQSFDRSARVLLRVVGPTLSTYGVAHPLVNPVLTLYNSKGEIVAQNDDWAVANTSADSATLAATMKQVGAFDLPSTSKDAAVLLDLPAGAYTLHATGGEGVVLLEIYLVR